MGRSKLKNDMETNRHSSLRNIIEIQIIVGACLICYYNSANCGLVFDDISAIRENKDLRPNTSISNIFLNDFWGTPMLKEKSHKSYRPLTVLTFRANYFLHELEPFGYHIVNILLHIIVCVLWKHTCRILLLQCSAPAMTGVRVDSKTTLTSNIKTEAMENKLHLEDCSFLASILFAVHPIHTEAVTGIVGRAELLCSIFYLGAFVSYVNAISKFWQNHPRTQTNWIKLTFSFTYFLVLSMLCKEQGITVAGICIAYEIFIVQEIRPLYIWHSVVTLIKQNNISSPSTKFQFLCNRKSKMIFIKRILFLTIVIILLLIARIYVMGLQLPVFTRFDNPASAAASPSRQFTFSYLIYLNIWLLLFPCDLCCDWTMGTVPLIESIYDNRNILTAATFTALCGIMFRICTIKNLQQSRMLLMSIIWIILPFLPASNIFFPVGFVVAERVLYIPSMGFCLLVANGYTQLIKYMRNNILTTVILKSILTILLLSHGLKTHYRNYDWKNEYTLFVSGVQINDRNAKLFNNVGHALENTGRYHDALAYFQKAVQIQADDIGAHINVGRTYNHLGMYEKAEEAYLNAKALFPKIKPGESYLARIAPNHLNLYINLANLISRNQTRLEEADLLYKQAISMRADYVEAYINRGDILMKLNRTAQAQEVYENALLYDSKNADIYYNLGVVFLELKQNAKAYKYFDKAIELYPEHEQALLNSAILLQEIGGKEHRLLSRQRLYKVLSKDTNNEKVYFNLGMLAMDESNFEEAEQFFKHAIHIKKDFRSALFNLALLLADTNRPLDALPYLNQLIRYYSDHIKGLILLGDIYINHINDLNAAEECYRAILKYDPHNIQGLHNLCVIYVERKQLAKAAACLKYTHKLSPSEGYILKHLQIVETRLQNILKFPDSSPEKLIALSESDSFEFEIINKNVEQHV